MLPSATAQFRALIRDTVVLLSLRLMLQSDLPHRLTEGRTKIIASDTDGPKSKVDISGGNGS